MGNYDLKREGYDSKCPRCGYGGIATGYNLNTPFRGSHIGNYAGNRPAYQANVPVMRRP